jgi:hypothetical protein
MRLTTPGAILLGFLAIALAVFFGLRSRSGVTLDAISIASTSASAPSPLPDPVPVPAPPPSGALADATRALTEQHDALVKACWGPQKEGRVLLSVRARFDAQGHLATKVQLSPRGPVRVDVSECVANTLAPFAIAPANAPASVEIPLSIP